MNVASPPRRLGGAGPALAVLLVLGLVLLVRGPALPSFSHVPLQLPERNVERVGGIGGFSSGIAVQNGVAYIGRNPLDKPNIYIATGDSGMGMTHGTIAGILLTDLICGRKNDWEKLYDPSRKTLQAAWSFARENTNVAAQYADWITPGETDSLTDIPRDGGAVLRRGFSKIAAYRDGAGFYHFR